MEHSPKTRRPSLPLFPFSVIIGLVMVAIGIYLACTHMAYKQTVVKIRKEDVQPRHWQDDAAHLHEHAMLRRGRQLLEKCKHRPEVNLNRESLLKELPTILVDDPHELLVCYIPKVASSNIARLLMSLDEPQGNLTSVGEISNAKVNEYYHRHAGMREYSEIGKLERLRSYKRVVVVREPFERLISAFNDKIVVHQEQKFKEVVKRIQYLRHDRSNDAVTFAEFISYILQQRPSSLDGHWGRYTDICHPCTVKYNYVGRYETLHEDMTFLIHDIGADKIARFSKREELYRLNRSVTYLEEYYKTIPKEHLQKLRDLYAEDSWLLDYAIPEELSKLMKQ